jgi:hypothetical protein
VALYQGYIPLAKNPLRIAPVLRILHDAIPAALFPEERRRANIRENHLT